MMLRSRRLLRLASLLFAWAAFCAMSGPNGETARWLDAFSQLKSGLATNYANFQYVLTDRRMDLPTLAGTYEARIAAAETEAARRGIFDEFLREFRDPHLRIAWTGDDEPAGTTCSTANQFTSGVNWKRSDSFVPVADVGGEAFGAGLLRLPSGETVGIIGFRSFDPRDYPQCMQAAKTLSLDPASPCDQPCADRIDHLAGRLLDDALVRTVRELARRGATRIVVDIVDNQGGTDWVESAMRILAGPIRSPAVGMIRHPAWLQEISEREAAVRAEPASPARAGMLERLASARRALMQTCELGSAWTDRSLAMEGKALPCSTIVTGYLYSSGLAPAPEGSMQTAIYKPLAYGPAPRGVDLPLVLLVNDNSHSAAELFAAAIQDARAGVIMGIVTPGASCGTYTRTGSGFRLVNIGATVHVPDCVRLRKDGSNERRGIVPDRYIAWGPNDSGWIRLQKAIEALGAAN